MSQIKDELAAPPADERDRELWLQHAAGFILLRDVRGYATERLDPHLSPDCRAAALKGIDDALYGLMMVLDGVTGSLQGGELTVNLKVAARLMRQSSSADGIVAEVDLADGDGMCMGYHGWIDKDFVEHPVVTRKNNAGAS